MGGRRRGRSGVAREWLEVLPSREQEASDLFAIRV